MLSGEIEVLHGWDAVVARAEPIAALHDTISTPVDARLPWLGVWADVHPERSLTALAAYATDGTLEGLAPLACRSIGPLRSIVAAGQGFTDHSSVVWRDATAAARLADAVQHWLADLHRPWQLWLDRLPPGAELDAFAGAVGSVRELQEGPEAPQVVFGADRDPRRYESANTRKSLARMHNRIRRDGHTLSIEVLCDARSIRRALPDVIKAHRERDLQLRGGSMLDQDPARDHYIGVVDQLAGVGAIRLIQARIDGALAAYVVAIVDGNTLRVYDNRVVPGFLVYSAGAIANSEILHLALADPGLAILDWGVGDARYKHSSATSSAPSRNLAAWSAAPVRSAWRAGVEVSRRTRGFRSRRPESRARETSVPS